MTGAWIFGTEGTPTDADSPHSEWGFQIRYPPGSQITPRACAPHTPGTSHSLRRLALTLLPQIRPRRFDPSEDSIRHTPVNNILITPAPADGRGCVRPRVCSAIKVLLMTPALEGLSFTINTLPGTYSALPLDNRQLQDNNRHDEHLQEAISAITIFQEARHFFNKTHRLNYGHF
jgi:hypothetical protein